MKQAVVKESSSTRRQMLSREAVLEAGLRIARREDLEQLTIRKLADELGVTPMAVYRYFSNKAEIMDGVFDLFVREAAVTDHDAKDWEEWIRLTFSSMRKALLETPGVFSQLGTTRSFGENTVATMNESLGVLREAGLGAHAATEAYLTLTSYTIGTVGLELALRRSDDLASHTDPEERLRLSRLRFESRPRSEFPHIVDVASAIADVLHDRPFLKGLDRIIDSMRREIRSGRSND